MNASECRLCDLGNVVAATDRPDGWLHAGHMSIEGSLKESKETVMYLKPTNPSTMMDYTPIFAEETDILGRFAERLNRADDVTSDAGTTWTS